MELTKTKFKRTEMGMIPEDWIVLPIRQIAKNEDGGIKIGPFGSALKKELLVKRGYKVYGQENVYENNLTIGDRYISKEHFYKLKSCEIVEGDFLVSMMGTVGQCMIVQNLTETGIMDSHLLRIKLNEKTVHNRYFEHTFKSIITYNQVKRLSVGGIMEGLSSKIIKQIQIPLPPTLSEQKAIATALSDVDEMIAKLEKLIEKKKAIKQGTMQQLLTPPQKGGKRLEGFSGEWTRSIVKDVIRVSRGGSPRPIQDFITNSQTGINWIKIGDTSPYSKYINSSQEKIIPEGQAFSRNVFVGDFLLSNSMSFGRPYILNINGCIHDGWLVLQDYSDYFDKDFLYYTLMTTDVYRQYLSKASGSSVLNLNKELVKSVELNRPVDLEEQRAISKILSNLDLEILEKEKTKSKLEKIKQGMMQELLTGRTRLI